MKTKRSRMKMLQKQAKREKAKSKTLDMERLKAVIRGMMVTSPTPWKVQEKTGDIIDANGRFVARVGWGIDKFKTPVDQNNRDLILKAVQFYMEQKELEAKKAETGEKEVVEPEVVPEPPDTEPIEDVPPIQGTDEARIEFMKDQIGV